MTLLKVYHGSIITVDKNNSIKKYLVEDNGLIIFTGDTLPNEYKNAQCVELEGGALMPTFADSHGHFASYAMLATTVKLNKARSNTEIIEILKEADKSVPPKKTILCFGASPKVTEGRLIEKNEIDAVLSHRTVVIICSDGHCAVLNQRALDKMPEIVKKTNGYNGDTGILMHESFYKMVDNILKVISAFDALQAFQGALDTYMEKGFGLICAQGGTGFPLDLDVELLKWLFRGQKNGAQGRIFIQSFNIKKAKKRGIDRLGGCFECALDGSITSSDAALYEPYEGTDNRGILFHSDEELYDKIKNIHLAGMAFQMHAIGDRAVIQAARTYKKILEEYPRENHRHGIIHATFVPEEAMKIIEEYGIQIIGQPAFIELSEENYDFMYGKLGERVWIAEPHNEFIERGVNFSASSDCPVTFPDGLSWIHWMVNNPNTKHTVDLTNAIRVCTVNGYFSTFDEHNRGSLEVGKIADMVLLDKSPFEVAPSEIKDIKVLGTYFKGKQWSRENRNVIFTLLRGMLINKSAKL
ncbi:MAG: N-substituted formamide deformylase precursor [Firmicutes bacterium ADurb.Bin300]|nr:MAG: N-substituted formamide deformylase precursor [Firmicutes bacterium ADurb.Bin300]